MKIPLGLENVDADGPENKGRTPLSYAAEEGHEGVVKMLLEREEVGPGKPDNHGRTPLLHAAGYQNGPVTAEGVVEFTSGRGKF